MTVRVPTPEQIAARFAAAGIVQRDEHTRRPVVRTSSVAPPRAGR